MTTTRVPTGINLIFRVISRMMVALIVSLPIIGLGIALIIYSQTDGSVPIWTGFAALIAGLLLLILGFYLIFLFYHSHFIILQVYRQKNMLIFTGKQFLKLEIILSSFVCALSSNPTRSEILKTAAPRNVSFI